MEPIQMKQDSGIAHVLKKFVHKINGQFTFIMDNDFH